jgi:hypothetical protein
MNALLIAFAFAGMACDTVQSHTANDSSSLIQVSGRVVVSNMGFAPVPAFSFNSPVVTGLLSVKRKRLRFEADMAVGLNGKPWMANNWFRLTLIEQRGWKANLGINPSLFFKSERPGPDKEIIHAHRNLTAEAAAERQFPGWALRLTYQRIRAFDAGTLSGNFLDVSSSLTIARWQEKLSLHVQPQLFYFNFDGDIDGLFTSATLTAEHARLPLSFYTQGVLPLWTDFPGNSFKWNFGLYVTFK